MPTTISDSEIDSALSPETVSATERALLRRVLDLECRVRALEGEWARQLGFTGAVFLDQVKAELSG